MRASLLLTPSLLVSVSRRSNRGTLPIPSASWVEVARAIRGFHVVSAGQVQNLGYYKELGCQSGKGCSSNFDIHQSKNGWFSEEGKLDGEGVLVLCYEERLKELAILILERIFKRHIITIQKYFRCPWLKVG